MDFKRDTEQIFRERCKVWDVFHFPNSESNRLFGVRHLTRLKEMVGFLPKESFGLPGSYSSLAPLLRVYTGVFFHGRRTRSMSYLPCPQPLFGWAPSCRATAGPFVADDWTSVLRRRVSHRPFDYRYERDRRFVASSSCQSHFHALSRSVTTIPAKHVEMSRTSTLLWKRAVRHVTHFLAQLKNDNYEYSTVLPVS